MQIMPRLGLTDAGKRRCHRALQITCGGLPLLYLAIAGTVGAQPWIARGPGPNTQGQVENIANREVVGAIHAVAPHPTDANVVYVGAVNGGVWMTTNAMAASPTWVQMTDAQESLSIGALEFDPTDATNQILLAGIGRFSSLGGLGGARTGLLRTGDGGATWTSIDGGGTLDGQNISGVAPRGNTIVVAATNGGIFRSTDGVNFTQISGGAGTGLPTGGSFDLTGDPTNPARLYTNSGSSGLYESNDAGATWVKVSDAAMDALISGASNIEIAAGANNNVYVAIVNGGQLAGVFLSPDDGATWAAMDLPATAEGGIHPGGQGGTHLSVAADPGNANIVYIGGDRQPSPFPNSIGAVDFSGRLFRGDASQAAGSQFVHLTHSNSMGAAGGGTTSSSAPHADSRDMDVAANGVLIEVDDGGIYRRTNPQTNNGDWFSMNGDIQTTEFHAVAWDADADIVMGGAQDTGTPQQQTPSNVQWQSVSTADGGVAVVDDASTPGFSTRYSSNQNLGGFRRRVYMGNVFQSQVFPALTPLGGAAAVNAQFYTPIELNNVTPTRLIIGAANGVYESLDQGNTVSAIAPGVAANGFGRDPIAYGAAGNAEILYVGSGAQVFVRTAANPAPLVASATYPGGFVAGIAIDPADPQTAYVVDATNVLQTTDAGATWNNITGNLAPLGPGTLRSIAYSAGTADGLVVVGGDTGAFWAPGPDFSNWSRLGTELPTVPVFELEYDAADEIFLAGTLGRGAWTLDVGELPDLAIAKADSPDPVPAGGQLVYTLTVTNNGPSVASDVQVTDDLPAGVTYISDDSGCSHAVGTVTCSLGELTAADTVSIEIVVEVDGLLVDNTGSATIVNEASVGGPTPDLDLGDNMVTEDTSVLPGCGGMFATIVGTPAGDNFVDTAADDVIATLAGDDAVVARGGDDAICAGGGDDHVVDLTGDNQIDAGPGNDNIAAGSGNDVIDTGSGNDAVAAGSGDDTIDAGFGDDHINTGSGSDEIAAGSGNDNIAAGSGNNVIDTGSGNDAVAAGSGDDTIDAGFGDDHISTGSGSDEIAAGSGNDNIAAGSGDDMVDADSGDDNVNAGPGDDNVNAGPGQDLINGGPGTDTCVGGELVASCE